MLPKTLARPWASPRRVPANTQQVVCLGAAEQMSQSQFCFRLLIWPLTHYNLQTTCTWRILNLWIYVLLNTIFHLDWKYANLLFCMQECKKTWLTWLTWRDMEYEVMRWRHRISITVPVQNTDTSMTRRGKRAPRHGILEGYASASAVVDNSASQIWATKRWRSNCFQIRWSWSKAIRAKEALPPDSSLSTLEAVFVLENTCAVELCWEPCLWIMIFLWESPARTCSSLICFKIKIEWNHTLMTDVCPLESEGGLA